MGGAQRNPSVKFDYKLMGCAALHPSYVAAKKWFLKWRKPVVHAHRKGQKLAATDKRR
jgi:hypothetical protein